MENPTKRPPPLSSSDKLAGESPLPPGGKPHIEPLAAAAPFV
jgi:hypothetical protein